MNKSRRVEFLLANNLLKIVDKRTQKLGRFTAPAPKRVFDFALSLVSLLAISPLMVLIGCLIFVSDGRPILFRHKRVGKDGATFYCLKFRTMANGSEQILLDHLASDSDARAEWTSTRKLKRDPRITEVGAVLRKSSLDELPQLINVLKGDMSLVGPRPIVYEEVAYYGDRIADYKRVRPGLTGLWQVGGRNDVSFETRVALDCQYASAVSVWRDIYILLRTIPVVLKAVGSY